MLNMPLREGAAVHEMHALRGDRHDAVLIEEKLQDRTLALLVRLKCCVPLKLSTSEGSDMTL